MAPYTVLKQVSDQNYIISTPEHRKSMQLCHVNLLKPYYAHTPQLLQCSAQLGGGQVHTTCVVDHAALVNSSPVDLDDPEQALLLGHLKNSQVLRNLGN